jgi:hypothetical protein
MSVCAVWVRPERSKCVYEVFECRIREKREIK